MGLGTGIDSLIAVVAPGWGARRSEARLRMQAARDRRALAATFGAAERSRLTSDWSNKNTSADAAIVPDMDVVNARARAAVRDDWAAAAIVSGYRRHVVGMGITCRSNARDPKTGEPLSDFNKRADAIWKLWCRAQFCDLERRKSFVSFQSMLIAERVTVGEAFVIIRRVNDPRRERMGVPGVVLQGMEVEQLDRNTWQADNGNYVRNGIEIDKYGAAVAFWFYTEGHPLDVSGAHNPATYNTVRVPAEDICHVMRVDRPRQTHGISRFAPILKNLRHLQMYNEYQLVAARMEACFGAAIETTGPVEGGNWGVAGADGTTTNDAKGNEEMNFEPGMFPRLRPGEKISWHDPQRPGELYEPFVQAQVNQIATGAGLDYTTVVRDFKGGTYSGQRQAMIERDYEVNPEQQDLIEQFCMPVRDAVIEAAIMEGLIDAPGFNSDSETAQAYLECTWRPQAKPWIDPNNQAMAAETALKNNLTTLRDLLNEQAQDWREVLQQRADEQAELQRLAAKAAMTPGANGNGVGGTGDSGLNGAQITAAIDVLTKLREKMMAPPAAVELLTAIGIPRDRAVQIVRETPVGLDNEAGDVAFKRDILKKLLDVPAAREAVYNATDVEDLIAQTGLSPEKDYLAPYIPVIAAAGPLVSGETIKDGENDIVGGNVIAEPEPEPKQPVEKPQDQGDGGEGSDDGQTGNAEVAVVTHENQPTEGTPGGQE